MTIKVGFLGFGCAVPTHVRTNDDPILDGIKAGARAAGGEVSEDKLFFGVRERRCLAPGESAEDLMIEAGRAAMASAGLTPAHIERLYGYSTVSEFITPNGLFKVHQGLALPRGCKVFPLNKEFSTFIAGAVLAWEAITSGHCRCAMITCGSSWTRNVDYTAAHAVSAGDGAGAAVVGPSERWTLVDYIEETFTEDDDYYGMTMRPRVIETNGSRHVALDDAGMPAPTYRISEGGLRSFQAHGMKGPPRLVRALLARNGISPEQVALITHQGSQVLMDEWSREIRPREYPNTLETYGNIGIATVPVTLAACAGSISSEYVMLASPGTGAHAAALLLRP